MMYSLKVSSAQDLPVNLFEFYDLITPKDKIKKWDFVNGKFICVKSGNGEVGLFSKEALKNYTDREWFLPFAGAPLFVCSSEELIVLAPFELPDKIIGGAVNV